MILGVRIFAMVPLLGLLLAAPAAAEACPANPTRMIDRLACAAEAQADPARWNALVDTLKRDAVVPTGGGAGVRRVRFTSTQDESANPCLAELEAIGTFDDPTLSQFADTVRPSTLSVTPSNGALDVGLNSSIVVEFDEAVNPSTVNASTLTVRLIDISRDPTVVGS